MKKSLRVKRCRWLELQFFNDGPDGFLTIAEEHVQIPFPIARVFFINRLSNKNAIRGVHAHKTQEQAIFCINGSFELEIYDGKNRQQITLDNPRRGIYVGPKVWNVMRAFSRDCVILVFSSGRYKESDYIRDFREFKRFLKKTN